MKIPFQLSRLINSAPRPVGAGVNDDSDPVVRGRYLTRVGGCVECHTPRDGMGTPIAGMDFAGGRYFGEYNVASANLTPDASGIGYYDEAMFIKTLRTGHAGARSLYVPMPWWNFRNMKDEDLKDR